MKKKVTLLLFLTAVLVLFSAVPVSAASLKVISASSYREESARTVDGTVFSSSYSYPQNYLYATSGGKIQTITSAFAGSEVLSNGKLVYYFEYTNGKLQLMRMNLSTEAKKKILTVNSKHQGVNMVEYYGKQLYVIYDMPDGTFARINLSKKTSTDLMSPVTGASRYRTSYILSDGTGAGHSYLGEWDTSINKYNQIVSQPWVSFAKSNYIYAAEIAVGGYIYDATNTISIKRFNLNTKKSKTLIKNLKVTSLYKVTDQYVRYRNLAGEIKIRYYSSPDVDSKETREPVEDNLTATVETVSGTENEEFDITGDGFKDKLTISYSGSGYLKSGVTIFVNGKAAFSYKGSTSGCGCQICRLKDGTVYVLVTCTGLEEYNAILKGFYRYKNGKLVQEVNLMNMAKAKQVKLSSGINWPYPTHLDGAVEKVSGNTIYYTGYLKVPATGYVNATYKLKKNSKGTLALSSRIGTVLKQEYGITSGKDFTLIKKIKVYDSYASTKVKFTAASGTKMQFTKVYFGKTYCRLKIKTSSGKTGWINLMQDRKTTEMESSIFEGVPNKSN